MKEKHREKKRLGQPKHSTQAETETNNKDKLFFCRARLNYLRNYFSEWDC